MKEQAYFPIPQDLMIEILLLLPFESILVCKLVSKQWKNLINNPDFFNLYPNESVSLFIHRNSLKCLSISHERHLRLFHLPISINENNGSHIGHRILSGSSNRIACVKTTNGQFLFYNLFTGNSYNVVDAPIRRHSNDFWLAYGFGYDRHEDDYKILVVCWYVASYWLNFDPNIIQKRDNSQFWIYSFRNRGWKPFNGFPYAEYDWSPFRALGFSFNGVLHWVVTRRGTRGKVRVVATLDMHTCRFGEISLPTRNKLGVATRVAELDGKLCCCGIRTIYFDVWVMKEYGVSESWSKLLSINRSGIRGMPYDCIEPAMLYGLEDGRKLVLFVCVKADVSFFWYDMENDEIERVDKGALGVGPPPTRVEGSSRILPMLRNKLKVAMGAALTMVVGGLIGTSINEIANLDYDYEFSL